PILTNDEIGELGATFNHMSSQLHYHMEALRQEKEQLSSIVNSMADGVITLNREAKVILSNPPAKLFMQDCEFETNEQHLPNQLPIQLIDLYNQVIVEEKEVIDELQIQGKFYVIIITPLYD